MNTQPLPMDRDSILERMAEPVWNAYNDHSHGPGPWKACRTSPYTQDSVQEHLADAALALDTSGLMERIAEFEAELRTMTDAFERNCVDDGEWCGNPECRRGGGENARLIAHARGVLAGRSEGV